MKYSGLIIFLLSISLGSIAQEHEHSHKHLHNDIGLANTVVYDFNEKNYNYGLHVHAIKGLSESWSVGIGYETIFADHQHHSLTLIGKYHFSDVISFNFGPGITFPSEEHNEYNLTGHFELVSIFDIKFIHIGPIVGFGIGEHEKHLSFGLHFGLEL